MAVNVKPEKNCDDNIKCVLEFLQNGTSKIDFSQYNEAVLILGPTGSGKSTLTQLLAGDDDKLHSTFNQNDTNFYFIDDDSKIREPSSFSSHTIIPELVYDKDTKTAYIDCPGFDDNRDPGYNIGIAYFIVQVFQQIKKVKILLVISNNLIESNGDRDNLLQLLLQVSLLLKNIDKYIESIALVVTKVYSDITEKNMINRIVYSLKNAKNFILDEQKKPQVIKMKDDTSRQLYNQNSVILLDSLVRPGEGKDQTSKIGIFRRPNEEKTVSSMPLFQDNKNVLKSKIDELKYSTIDERDIGFAISEKSKTMINYLIQEANESIVSDIGYIGEIIIKYYEQMEMNMIDDDMFSLIERLGNIHKFLNDLQKSPGNDWVAQYRAHLDKPCVRASKHYLNNMASLNNFIIFLEKVNGKKLDSYASDWIKKLNVYIHNIENSIKWYQFLSALYETLSKYKIQKDRNAFVAPKLQQYEGPLQKWKDFVTFVDKLQDPALFKMISFQDLQKVTIDSNKLKYFNKVIESTMGGTISYQTFDRGQRLQISGDYIKFSDLVNNKMYQSCKSVQILATHTVFIDANLTKENDLLVIAPRWDIIGSQIINLDGSFGPYHKFFRAPSGAGKGADGEPGNVGESAGHFFGIGMNFTNPDKLTVSAIGGSGGNGQHGGDGQPGKNSPNAQPLKEEKPHIFYCPYDVTCKINFTYQDTSTKLAYGIEGLTTVEMRVPDGDRGGDCGFGGGPGLGGYEGTAEILNLGSELISIGAQIGKGSDGLFGLHGRVGKGGTGGKQWDVNYIFQDNDPLIMMKNYFISYSKDGDQGSCSHSMHPSYSYTQFNKNELLLWNLNRETTNMNVRQTPSKKYIMYKISDVLSDYRNLLVDNFSNSIKKRYSLEFYGALLQNEYISTNDTIPGIYSEMGHLETCHNEFTEDINQIVYLSLQKRMQFKEKNMSQRERSKHQDLQNFISLAITSKLIRFGTFKIPQMISNLPAYVDVLKTTNPDKIFSHFSQTINTKSQQVTLDLIDTMDLEISNIIEQKTKGIVKSLDRSDEKELVENLINRKLFSCFKTITTFLNLCESLAISDMEFANTMNITQIIPYVQPYSSPTNGEAIMKQIKTMEKIFNYESEAAELAFFLANDALIFLDSNFDHVRRQISEIQKVVQGYESSISSSYVYPLFSNSSDIIQNINNIDLEIVDGHDNHEVCEIIKRLQRAFKLIAFDADLYHRLTIKNINIEHIISAIEGIKERAASFNTVEHEIFKIMKPVLISVRENLEGKLYKPRDITKLREIIVEALKHMKSYLITMTIEFKETKSLPFLTENLDETMILLLNTYQGVLPIYHDRALLYNLYSYFENQQAINKGPTKISNTIMNDILFYEYERLIQIYKKLVFPLDILFPETFSIPAWLPCLSGTESSTSLEQSFISNIQDLESKLDYLRNSEIFETNLFSRENLSGPFFTWKYDDHRETIGKLLRGEKVAMKAKLSKGDSSFLKFTDIRLRFILKNSANQTEFDNQLKNFKVTMTHTGNSYFGLCDLTHLHNQGAIQYVYNFDGTKAEVDSDGNYIPADFDSSTCNDKECNLERPALSPFTLWIFEMMPIRDEVTFESIKSFSEVEIDLDLEGHAKFITLNDEKAMCLEIETNSDSISEEMLAVDLDKEMINVDGEIFRDKTKRFLFTPYLIGIGIGIAVSIYYPNVITEVKSFFQSLIKKITGNDYASIMPSPPPPFITTPNPCKSIQSLDVNSTLVFVDYIIRNITREKLFNMDDKSISPAQARMIALIITDEFRDKMTEQQWKTIDPIELMSELEQNILSQDVSAIRKTLTESVRNINVALDKMKC